MSANDKSARAHEAAPTPTPATDTHAYYAVLAERLEKILLDMQQSGSASDDPLILRLADLLSETRGLLRKNKQS